MRLRVDWRLPGSARVPDAIRSAVERRLAALWRLVGSRIDGAQTRDGPCLSEEFALSLGGWSLTYEVDLSRGIAVVRHVTHGF
jgi:hypothetical protein